MWVALPTERVSRGPWQEALQRLAMDSLVFGADTNDRTYYPHTLESAPKTCMPRSATSHHSATQEAIWVRMEASSAAVTWDGVAAKRVWGTHWTFQAKA